jgi:hypothetical protein
MGLLLVTPRCAAGTTRRLLALELLMACIAAVGTKPLSAAPPLSQVSSPVEYCD